MLSSCLHKEMHIDTFAKITLGDPISKVLTSAGSPNSIKNIRPRLFEYEYIETIASQNGTVILAENHYYILVKHGIVIDKRYNSEEYILYKNQQYLYLNHPEF